LISEKMTEHIKREESQRREFTNYIEDYRMKRAKRTERMLALIERGVFD